MSLHLTSFMVWSHCLLGLHQWCHLVDHNGCFKVLLFFSVALSHPASMVATSCTLSKCNPSVSQDYNDFDLAAQWPSVMLRPGW